ncbi:MAG: hypothetical protein ACOCTI_08465 [Phycisphaeraceae bacterium]
MTSEQFKKKPAAVVPLDGLRLSPRERRLALDWIENRQPRDVLGNKRLHERLPRPDSLVLAIVEWTEHHKIPVGVQVRNISRQGVGLLHGAFVHPETPCSVTLITAQRQGIRATGEVAFCRHLKGHIHEVGIRLDREINLELITASVPPAIAS